MSAEYAAEVAMNNFSHEENELITYSNFDSFHCICILCSCYRQTNRSWDLLL